MLILEGAAHQRCRQRAKKRLSLGPWDEKQTKLLLHTAVFPLRTHRGKHGPNATPWMRFTAGRFLHIKTGSLCRL